MKKGKVLVTGGAGFIGSHLAERLLRDGRDVRILIRKREYRPFEKKFLGEFGKQGEIVYGDLRDQSSLKSAIKGVSTVYHLGAISRPMRVLKKEYYDNSILGTRNILEASLAANISKFVHVSSVSVLGTSPDGIPLRENDFQFDMTDYAASKREGEFIALLYHYKHGLPLTVIRPCLTYGPRCLVRLVMFKFVKYGLFPIFNDGTAKMEFLYVDNAVQSMILAESNKRAVGEVFNVTDGLHYSIGDVLNTIADVMEVRRPRLRIPVNLGVAVGHVAEVVSAVGGVYPPFSSSAAEWMSRDMNVYDCTRAKKILGYTPSIDLVEGIRRSVEWYRGEHFL